MRWDRATSRWGARIVALVVVLGALLVVAPTQARAQAAGGDTLSLALDNGSTFPYGQQPSPRFTVTLVLAKPFSENRYMSAGVTMDSGEQFGSGVPSPSQDGLTYTFDVLTDGGTILGGNRTATATFTNPDTGVTDTSNSVNFTITPANPQMNCTIANGPSLANPGQSLTIAFSYNDSPAPVDWQDGTYTISFSGPQNTTFPNMKGDSNDDVTVTAPSQIGSYKITCAFSGTNNFQASSGTFGYITVSAKHALGSVQFYTDPTTPATAKPVNVYVVFHPAPGLPTPTGYVSFTLVGGTWITTNGLQLNSDGTLLVNIGPIPTEVGPGSSWQVNYDGDPYYDSASVNFPLTNPAIPGGSGGSGGSGNGGGTGSFGNPQATPSAGTKATVTATTTRATTPTVTVASPNAIHTATVTSGRNMTLLWLAGALAVLILAGGAGGFVVWSRRRRLALAAANAGPPFMSAPPPGLSPYDDRTIADDDTYPYRDQ